MAKQNDPLIIRPKGDDGYHTFSIRVKNDILNKLEDIVDKTGRTRNELIGILLEYAIDHCEIAEKPSKD